MNSSECPDEFIRNLCPLYHVYMMLMTEASMDSNDTIDAETLIAELLRYQSLIPYFTQLTDEERLAMRRAATLSPEWLDAAINAIGASTTVETAIGVTYDGMRVQLADLHIWQSAETYLRVLLEGVSAANLIRSHRIGIKTLQAYGICRQLVRQPEHMHLLHHFDVMKQLNKMGKRRRKAAPEETPE